MPHRAVGNHRLDAGVVLDMKRPFRVTAATALLAGLLAVGCASVGATPSASPGATPTTSPSATPSPIPPSPTQPPAHQVSSAAQAAALVFAHEHIGRMGPLLPNMVGQSEWYEASENATGFSVAITVGSGDCPAGCIERHTWTYQVDRDGTITLVSDEGDDIGIPPATGTADPLALNISLTAGPTCPVEQVPPDPNCAARPVVNAEVVVFDASGQQVASGVSGSDGSVVLQLPAGSYFTTAQNVEGLLGQAAPLAFAGVGGDAIGLVFQYDTGIR